MTTLYEHGTLASLMAGNFDGTITVGDLLKHGSTGIGTLTGLDGEVVILDNEVYQAVSSGKVNHITGMDATMPFASVHFPAEQQSVTLRDVNFAKLNNDFVKAHKLNNVFAFLKLSGNFEHVKIRIAPKQEKPYPTLLEVAQHQPEFRAANISGTILGYYAPAIFGTITAAGWHLHFISDDRQFAGHLLAFDATELTGSFEVFDNLEQHLPINNKEFRESTVDMSTLREGIAKSEGNAE
ncbi:acetolactate decarboxylase [Limosilactobacillus walteri]|uniref:Alpha-acetolactate decarboxylase n=1 Tax=Limosilactobacillus walteri TaxID=2268022 RepID=A0ABR8P5T4_9LACO|nr:acetolactate decarboxylase [Limosilactobacillus walteri]